MRLQKPSKLTLGLVVVLILAIGGGIYVLSSKLAPKTVAQASPSPSATDTPEPTQTDTPTPTPTPTKTPTPKPKATTKPTATATSTPTPNPTQASTDTPNPTATATPTPNKVVSLSFDPSSTTQSVNQTFTEAIKIDPGSDQVSSAELHVIFDHTKLELESFTPGSALPIVLTGESHDNSAGTASITLGSSPGSPVTSTATLATITFKALSSGSGSVSYASNTQTASIGRSGSSLNSTSGATVTINP